MTSLPADDPTTLGFLTVVEVLGQGFIGGLLVLNPLARPLEFHCTAPVKPNRAQEILYGPTLAPYLYGEQIGQALLRAAQTRPAALFANQPEALAVASCVDMPVCLVMAGDDAPEDVVDGGAVRGGTNQPPQHPGHARDVAIRRVDPAQALPPGWTMAHWGVNRVACRDFAHRGGADPSPNEPRERDMTAWLPQLAASLDLNEPFSRIRSAIDEARRGAR